ncbi:hypothetical protein [Streptomyces sp. MMG1121]|uniref:hypothetical protein n=1 Tax=Streptomyces sp. MMG1121 TaxID=1415544 RepID=UPI0006AEA0BC|nr:hypothetical protein [Streptomyces sp. MMG1121]KOV62424.1 lipoprotein [Streptomyces sp. MMG1121]
MKSTIVRRATFSLAVVAALTGVAACGSAGAGKGDKAAGQPVVRVSPIAALRSAEQSTDKADSAKVRSVMSLGGAVTTTMSGAVSWHHGTTGDLTLTYTGGKLAEGMRRIGMPSIEGRFLPDALYVRMNDQFAQRMAGKHWLKYSYEDYAKSTGGSGASMKGQLQHSTPNQSVKLLLASGDVKKVGEDTVSGVRATHYAGTIDVADLAGRNRQLTADQLAAVKKQLNEAGITTERVDIWLNGQSLLVKSVSKADTKQGPLQVTNSYSDYGVPVSTEVPPAADTKDFKDLLKSLGTPGSANSSTGSTIGVPGAGTAVSS